MKLKIGEFLIKLMDAENYKKGDIVYSSPCYAYEIKKKYKYNFWRKLLKLIGIKYKYDKHVKVVQMSNFKRRMWGKRYKIEIQIMFCKDEGENSGSTNYENGELKWRDIDGLEESSLIFARGIRVINLETGKVEPFKHMKIITP